MAGKALSRGRARRRMALRLKFFDAVGRPVVTPGDAIRLGGLRIPILQGIQDEAIDPEAGQ